MTLMYRNTIEWAYRLMPSHRHTDLERAEWVTNYLASLHHWGALEEHLGAIEGPLREES